MSQIVSPSLLSANFANLQSDLDMINRSEAEWLHIDIMDGVFVPNLSFGPPVLEYVAKGCTKQLDVHLMVEHPESQVDSFIQAGADWITFHHEACVHSHRLIQYIQSKGKKAGIAIVPSTPISAISEILEYADIILVMTVNPGWGGQVLIPSCVKKIAELNKLREERGYKYLISVDGGINPTTISSVIDAGVDVIVSGSAFFSGELKLS